MDEAAIIKSQLTCTDFLQGVGVIVNRAGFCRCPFHGDHDASMKVYSDPSRGYHCFGCHDGGDVIHMAMKWYGLPFRDTIRRVADDFLIDLPDERQSSADQKRFAAVMAEMQRINRQQDGMIRRNDEDAFWQAFDAWQKNDRDIADNAPQSRTEPFSDAWCEAVRQREAIRDELQVCEERRKTHYARR